MILISQVDSLLQPVAAAAPCGSNLEYDPAFLDLERLVQGKPEQQMGSAVLPAQEPDWDAIARHAATLLGKTKDLRVALHLTSAWLNAEGFAGLCAGLAVLRGLTERYWDGCFPRLEPDDGNDPTLRVNVLMGLCDSAAFVDRIRALPLVTSRSFGRFSLRDLAIVSGELPPAPGTATPATTAIDGAFAESAVADLQAAAASVHESLAHVTALEATVGARVGAAHGPSFAKLSALLGQARKILAARLEQRGVKSAPLAGGSFGDAAAADPATPAQPALTGAVTSREDVARLLDRIREYYERHEPSSPLPLLLARCKRLVSASFLDIVRDVAPSAVSQVDILRGKDS
jgi:type VI secretion system protein ImpA